MGRVLFLGASAQSVAWALRDDVHVDPETLNPGQRDAYDAIKGNPRKNFRVVGLAGTGKSHLMRAVCTGHTVSAMTYHDFLGLRANEDAGSRRSHSGVRHTEVLRDLRLVVLEEIGLVPADYVDLLDSGLRTALRREEPFGGVQVVAVGDFGQMGTVGNDSVASHPVWTSLE